MNRLSKLLGHFLFAPDDGQTAGGASSMSAPPVDSPPAVPAVPAAAPAAVDLAALQASFTDQFKGLAAIVNGLAEKVAGAATPSKSTTSAAPASTAAAGLDELRAEIELRDALDAAEVAKDKRNPILRLFRADRPAISAVADWAAKAVKEFGLGKTAAPVAVATTAPLPQVNTNGGQPIPPASAMPTHPSLLTAAQVEALTPAQAGELLRTHLASLNLQQGNPLRPAKDARRAEIKAGGR